MPRKYVMQEDEDLFEDRKYFNEYIDEIANQKFKVVEDIDLENLRDFLIAVLHAFREKKVTHIGVLDILDYLYTYIHRRYMDEWPETHWPIPSDDDPMSIGLNALDFIKDGYWFGIYEGMSQDSIISLLMNYLKTPIGQERKATESIDKFMEELKTKCIEKDAREKATSSR